MIGKHWTQYDEASMANVIPPELYSLCRQSRGDEYRRKASILKSSQYNNPLFNKTDSSDAISEWNEMLLAVNNIDW